MFFIKKRKKKIEFFFFLERGIPFNAEEIKYYRIQPLAQIILNKSILLKPNRETIFEPSEPEIETNPD